MRAVNLIPSEARGRRGSKGAGALAGPSAPQGLGAYTVLAVLALAVLMAGAWALTGRQVADRKPSSPAPSRPRWPPRQGRVAAPVHGVRRAQPRARPRRVSGARRGPLRLVARAARGRTRRARRRRPHLARSARRARLLRRGRRGWLAALRAAGAGDRHHRLHEEPEPRRPAARPPARDRRRPARRASQLREVRAERRTGDSRLPLLPSACRSSRCTIVLPGAHRHVAHRPGAAAGPRRRRRPRRPGAPREPQGWILALAVLFAALVGAYWFLALAPKREEIVELDEQVAQAETAPRRRRRVRRRTPIRRSSRLLARLREPRPARQGRATRRRRRVAALPARVRRAGRQDRLPRREALEHRRRAARRRAEAEPADEASGDKADAGAPASKDEDAAGADARRPRPPHRSSAAPPGAVVGSAGLVTMPFTFTFDGGYSPDAALARRDRPAPDATDGAIAVRGRLLTDRRVRPDGGPARLPAGPGDRSAHGLHRPAGSGRPGRRPPQRPGAATQPTATAKPPATATALTTTQGAGSMGERLLSGPRAIVRELVSKRLWPIAVLLLVALVAVPSSSRARAARRRPPRRPQQRPRDLPTARRSRSSSSRCSAAGGPARCATRSSTPRPRRRTARRRPRSSPRTPLPRRPRARASRPRAGGAKAPATATPDPHARVAVARRVARREHVPRPCALGRRRDGRHARDLAPGAARRHGEPGAAVPRHDRRPRARRLPPRPQRGDRRRAALHRHVLPRHRAEGRPVGRRRGRRHRRRSRPRLRARRDLDPRGRRRRPGRGARPRARRRPRRSCAR